MTEIVSLGVDFGGTKIEGAVIARPSDPGARDRFRVLARKRVPTERERGYEAVLRTTLEVIRSTAEEARVDPRQIPIGVGMPGSVTRADGVVKNSNTLCLNGRPFRQDVQRALGGNVHFENDANCFALAEALLGAGRGHEDGVVFGVIMGTGVGGGLVLNGRVWGGLHGLGGEWGHHAVGPWRTAGSSGEPPPGGGLSERPLCACGKLGCLELYLSGSGAESEYLRRSGVARKLAEIVTLRERDPHAKLVVDELLEAYGRGLANVIDIVDPSLVVLGGGVSNLDLVYSEGRARVEKYVFNDELRTPIVKHALGDSSGVLGAALLYEAGGSGA
jgi:fructokinase